MGKIVDLSGERYGNLTVLCCIGKINGRLEWLCQCKCGNDVSVRGNSLRSGNTTSCGCIQRQRTSEARSKDITGQRFGRLTAIERTIRVNHSYNWICECDCGNKVEITRVNLVGGNSESCGCWHQERITKHGLSGDHKAYREYLWQQDPSIKVRHYVSNSIRKVMHGAKSGSCFDYLPYTPRELKEHLEQQFEYWMSWDNYGGRADSGLKTWWIDHITPQSSFLYNSMDDEQFRECWALSNLRPLEKIENIKKGVFNQKALPENRSPCSYERQSVMP